MTVLSYGLSLTNAAFLGPMRTAQGAVKGFTSQLSNISNIVTGLASLPGAIQTLVAPLSQPITLSSDMEALETSFKSLLKNGDAAKALVRDLIQFADATPFDPVPVAATGKQLLAFGFAAKEVKPLLKDIGDLAAAMDKPIEEVGDSFGRLRAGQFGEAFERMRAFGISMQDLQGAGLKFDASGQFQGSAEQAMEAVRQIIRRKFGGGMADLSLTFKGLFSTFQGYWDALQRSFGEPIMQVLKPVLEDATNLLKQWAPIAEYFGKKLATGISGAFNLFKSGELGTVIKTALAGGAKLAMTNISVGLSAAIQVGASVLSGSFKSAIALLTDGNFLDGLRSSILSIVDSVKAELMSTAADLISMLPLAMRLGANVDGLRKGADDAGRDAKFGKTVAAEQFGLVDMDKVTAPLISSATTSGTILGDAITQIATNIKNNKELAPVGEALKKAAQGSADPKSIAEMAQASRLAMSDTLVGGKKTWQRIDSQDGVTNRSVPLLNPQVMERLLNPSAKSEGGKAADLKKALDDASPLKHILTALQRITDVLPTLQGGTYPTF